MMRREIFALCATLALASAYGCDRQSASPTTTAQAAATEAAPTGAVHVSPPVSNPELDGYCPVALVEMKQLEKGSRDNQSAFEGNVYQMTNAKSEMMFQKNPTRYVPPFSAQDPVAYQESGERIAGNVALFVVHEDKPWFFVDEDNRARFLASPDTYVSHAESAN
jgi:YHS domain-containing protein